MHVRIETAVGVEFREVGVPGVDAQADLVVPELGEVDVLGLFEQFLGARAAREQRGGCRKQHEGVRVGLLGGHMADVRRDFGIPAVVLLVVQHATQTADAVVDEFRGAVHTEQRGQRVDVRHAAGDPGGAVAVLPRGAVVAQPVGAAVDRREATTECNEIVAGDVEELLVLRRSDLVLRICVGHVPLPSNEGPARDAPARSCCSAAVPESG